MAESHEWCLVYSCDSGKGRVASTEASSSGSTWLIGNAWPSNASHKRAPWLDRPRGIKDATLLPDRIVPCSFQDLLDGFMIDCSSTGGPSRTSSCLTRKTHLTVSIHLLRLRAETLPPSGSLCRPNPFTRDRKALVLNRCFASFLRVFREIMKADFFCLLLSWLWRNFLIYFKI